MGAPVGSTETKGRALRRPHVTTFFFIVAIAVHLFVAYWSFSAAIPPYDPRKTPLWAAAILCSFSLVTVAGVVALWRWKSWGFVAICLAAVLSAIGYTMLFGLRWGLAGLLFPIVTYGFLNIGKAFFPAGERGSVWPQLDGVPITGIPISTPLVGAFVVAVLGFALIDFGLPVAAIRCEAGPDSLLIEHKLVDSPQGSEVMVLPIDGSDRCHLTKTDSDRNSPVSLSPNGELILFFAQENSEGPIVDLFVMKRDGTDMRRLTDAASRGPVFSGRWSPDGEKILYSAGFDLEVVDRDGSDTRTVVEGSAAGGHRWSPTGDMIAFNSQNGEDQGEVSVVDSDGSNERVLVGYSEDDPASDYPVRYVSPVGWLSDETLLIERGFDKGYDVIYAVDLQAPEDERVLATGVRGGTVRLSPDKKSVLFAREVDGDYDTVLFDLETETERQLTTSDSYYRNAVFSPDGSHVAMTNQDLDLEDPIDLRGRTSIVIVNVDSGAVTQLASEEDISVQAKVWIPVTVAG